VRGEEEAEREVIALLLCTFICTGLCTGLCTGAASAEPAPEGEDSTAPIEFGAEETRAGLDSALAWLIEEQNDDGSWATGVIEGVVESGFPPDAYFAWKSAASSLACLALLESEETPARRAALERGLGWLCDGRRPRRARAWDVDHVWAGLYGTVALVRAAGDERFTTEPWAGRLRRAGDDYLGILRRNQSPKGGWAYYDDPIYSRRPKWDTSFCTALVLPALAGAIEMGWLDDEAVLERGKRYVLGCALSNGAWGYDLDVVPRLGEILGGEHIDSVKGSLARTQVCHFGLASVGVERITSARIREGLESFFRHHRFLDVAWLKPIPHEAYYHNSGYFYLFGHYYAAEVIERLPEAERASWHARLRGHLLPRQRADGSTSDYLISSYAEVAGTSFFALALQLGLPPPASDSTSSPR
jgi:hypothetical protein